ncbi:hypothetical protein [Marinithermofilum abyssi]|nr:hypothetical protein [Marinithermofilum abyssi]
MGKVIDLEETFLERAERLRLLALKFFPWTELDRVMIEWVEPFHKSMSARGRVAVEEAVYRLAFDSFVMGLKHCRVALEQGAADTWEYRRWFFQVFGEEADQLFQKAAEDFQLFQVLEDMVCQSVWLVLEEVVPQWFFLGTNEGKQLRKQRML